MLPRTALAFPVYSLVAAYLALPAYRKLNVVFGLGLVFFMYLVQFCILSLGHRLSFVSFILEFLMIMPLFIIIFSSSYAYKGYGNFILKANLAVSILSCISMALYHGFPAKLPYINFLPDAISAFWGNGGVKIVTILGFFGILYSVMTRFKDGYLLSVFSMINFLAPSYNIGIMCGILALGFYVLRNGSIKTLFLCFVFFILFFLLVVPYINSRLGEVNSLFVEEFGFHPKIYSFFIVSKVFIENPLTILLGAGLGNFSGSAALWSSDYLAEISSHERINLPGLYQSSLMTNYLDPALSLITLDRWSLSSSLNKPYSTFSTLIVENGFVFGCGIIFLFFKSMFKIFISNLAICLSIFFFLVFLFDNLHSNPLFWIACLFGIRSLISVEFENDC